MAHSISNPGDQSILGSLLRVASVHVLSQFWTGVAMLLEVCCHECSTASIGESEENPGKWDHLENDRRHTESSVGALALFDVALLLRGIHAFELKVACMSGRSAVASLEKNENDCTNDRDEVERQ